MSVAAASAVEVLVPGRLAAAEPGWVRTTDVVVVGSGVAGLSAALHLRALGLAVLVVSKSELGAGCTPWAQGGIAAALAAGDSPAAHAADTLTAGAGLCDPEAVQVLVEEGPRRVRDLQELGARFDRAPDGSLALTREGGHLTARIAHAGGDATGAELSRALLAAVRADPAIGLIEHAMALDLLRDGAGRAAGVTVHVLGTGRADGVGQVHAAAVVLATGGLGELYASTTNPAGSTGDGVALALRAGAEVADLEFVQFHPTALWLGARARGQQPLVSEAVRGEGAVLVDRSGEPVMAGRHPLADLAPRDVVTRGMSAVMAAQGVDHLYLDARPLGAHRLQQRFPSILARCRSAGIDPVRDMVPVTPAAHYASGGVRTDLWGRTSVPGLYACGEVACTGVHGANRLASNSLLEGLVFAARIAQAVGGADLTRSPVAAPAARAAVLEPELGIGPLMSRYAGVLRSGPGLRAAAGELAALAGRTGAPGPAAWQATNQLTVAAALVAAAERRRESRGCHWRRDHPDCDPAPARRLAVRLDAAGAVRAEPA